MIAKIQNTTTMIKVGWNITKTNDLGKEAIHLDWSLKTVITYRGFYDALSKAVSGEILSTQV